MTPCNTHTHTVRGSHSDSPDIVQSDSSSPGELRLQNIQDSSQDSLSPPLPSLTPVPHQEVGGVCPAPRPQQLLLQAPCRRPGGGACPRLVLSVRGTSRCFDRHFTRQHLHIFPPHSPGNVSQRTHTGAEPQSAAGPSSPGCLERPAVP